MNRSIGTRRNIRPNGKFRGAVFLSAVVVMFCSPEASAEPPKVAPPVTPSATVTSANFDRRQIAIISDGLGGSLYRASLEIYLGHEEHALAWIGELFRTANQTKISTGDLRNICQSISDSFADARKHSTRQGLVSGVVFHDINEVPNEAYEQLEKFYIELSVKLGRGEKPSSFVPGPNLLATLNSMIKQVGKPKSTDDMLVLFRLKGVAPLIAARTLLQRAQVSGDSSDYGSTMSNIESGLRILRAEKVSPSQLADAYLSASKSIESLGDEPPRNDLRWRRLSKLYAQRAWDVAESQPVSAQKVAILTQLISSRSQFWQMTNEPAYARLPAELTIMKETLAVLNSKKQAGKTIVSAPNTVLKKVAVTNNSAAALEQKLNVCFETIKDAVSNVASRAEIMSLISKADEECTQHHWSQFRNSISKVMSSIETAPLNDAERRACNLAMGQVLYEQFELEQSNLMQQELHSDIQCGSLAQVCFERALTNGNDEKVKFQTLGKLARLTGSDEYYKKLLEMAAQKGHSERERYQLLMDYAHAQSSKGDGHHAKDTYAQAFALSKKIGVTMTGVDTADIRSVFERDNDYLGALPFYEEEMRECRQRLGNDFKFSKYFVDNYCNCLIKAGKPADAEKARATLKVDRR